MIEAGEVVSTTAFVIGGISCSDYKGAYIRLVDGSSEAEKDAWLREAVMQARNIETNQRGA